ncbi:MAG: ATP-dependent sacrificial sulfur transferase LarE [Nitrososphaerota archaeon]|nr:ATP-dependent sacrificial sulfur transferase LarE [Nitrososphaerota archaeon]
MQTAKAELDPNESRSEFEKLVEWFSRFDSCIVAFSAGVDSSLLALAAKKALGRRAYAVTSHSASFSHVEQATTTLIAKEIGIELIVVNQDDLASKEYVKNNVDRCYFCRSNLAQEILPLARRLNVRVCVDGTQTDDLKTPRPGIRALREAGFRAPLVELGFNKDDVRAMAKCEGLSNWDRPSEACLSSRIAYGQAIDFLTLAKIEKAETTTRRITGARIVRVRTIGDKAVVELNKEHVPNGILAKGEIERELRALGYKDVEIDKEGYVSGKMLSLFVQDNS